MPPREVLCGAVWNADPDPDGPIRITNCADIETELLFMTFDIPVESPKSLSMTSHG